MDPPSNRFALLRHELPAGHERPPHFDLLLEHEGIAWTWELGQLPVAWCKQGVEGPVAATRLPDHRLHYLEYEGPISGDRGWVTRLAGGACHWVNSAGEALRAQLICPEWSTQVLLVDLQAENGWRLEVVPTAAL